MKINTQRYIVVIEGMKTSLTETLNRLKNDHPDYEDVKFLLLSQAAHSLQDLGNDVTVLQTDYSAESLKNIFEDAAVSVIAVLCRGDKYVQYLRKVLPYLPQTVRVASSKSLEITTNKRMMRQAFEQYAPEITPGYLKVTDAEEETLQSVSARLKYPVIVKPASLASSLMIQRCNDEESLRTVLSEVFSKLEAIYSAEGRAEPAEVIVEEFLVGSFYSIDAYSMQSGDVYYTPIIEYLPAESMGINDFFLYKRWTDTRLSRSEVLAAQATVRKSIEAVGLEHSSVHAELVRTKDGWKIIEIGPRIGRFRNIMYKSAFGIDHGYNDLLIHLGIKPLLTMSNKTLNYVAAYSIYPTKEGILKEIHGLDMIEKNIPTLNYLNISNSKTGEYVRFARNGGHALAEIVFSCETKAEYDIACKWFDENVFAIVEGSE